MDEEDAYPMPQSESSRKEDANKVPLELVCDPPPEIAMFVIFQYYNPGTALCKAICSRVPWSR